MQPGGVKKGKKKGRVFAETWVLLNLPGAHWLHTPVGVVAEHYPRMREGFIMKSGFLYLEVLSVSAFWPLTYVIFLHSIGFRLIRVARGGSCRFSFDM